MLEKCDGSKESKCPSGYECSDVLTNGGDKYCSLAFALNTAKQKENAKAQQVRPGDS
jgi:hypothetical protein